MTGEPELDAQRSRTVAALRTLAVDGHLTLEEFSDRVGEVYAASTGAELDALSVALPVGPAASSPSSCCRS